MAKLFWGVVFGLIMLDRLAQPEIKILFSGIPQESAVLVQDDQDQDQDIPRSDEEGGDDNEGSEDELV